jgi:hypothetical protein
MYGIRNGAKGDGFSSGGWKRAEITWGTEAFATLEVRAVACA